MERVLEGFGVVKMDSAWSTSWICVIWALMRRVLDIRRGYGWEGGEGLRLDVGGEDRENP